MSLSFKIITRMNFLFPNVSGDYSYSFQASFELIGITVTVSLVVFSGRMQLQEIIPLRNFQEFSEKNGTQKHRNTERIKVTQKRHQK